MKSFAVLASLVAIVAANCGGDNCARQVTGTRAGLLDITSRKADCSHFMTTTIVPDATTTTVTITVDPDEPTKSKRAVEARSTDASAVVPAYASGCSGSASRYSSVCSCWGITASATTAATPTKTVTVTVTSDYCEDL